MRNKLGNVLWGLAFIGVGVCVAGNIFDLWNFNVFFDGWWTLFIIIPCGISIIQNGFNTGNSIGIAIGVLLLLSQQNILPSRIIMSMFFPVLLVIIGLSIIFRPSYKRASYKYANGECAGHASYTTASDNGAAYSQTVETNIPNDSHKWNTSCGNEILAVFCGNNGSYAGREFKGASCTAVFGGVDLDLQNAIITKDVTVNATAIFGGVEIYTGNNIQVVYRSVPIFGGVDCRVPARDKSLPTLFINCVSIFGGIDIK